MTGLQESSDTTPTPDQTPAVGRYRKKPVEIDAVQWTGKNGPEVAEFMGLPPHENWPIVSRIAMVTIHNDRAFADPGDWIVAEPEPGRFYPIKPDIFEANYEPADRVLRQVAPWPELLERFVGELEYRAGWRFSLEDIDRGQGSEGLTFIAIGQYPDSYHPERTIRVAHYFPVPPAAYNEQSWRRWLLERLLEIERHEACEFFRFGEERPYAPHHGPGNDPYIVFEHGSDVEARTSFRGDVKPEHPDESNVDDDCGAGGC